MRFRGLLWLIGALLAVTVAASDAPAAKGVKKSGEHRHHGTVVAVEKKKGGEHSLTIKVHPHHKKKKGQATAAKTSPGAPTKKSSLHKYTVSGKTRFEVVHNHHHHAASFKAVHKGEHVVIYAHHQHADKVILHPSHHKSKAKKTAKT